LQHRFGHQREVRQVVSEKARENRLRRMADRYGLRLLKARSRDVRAIDYGCYALADLETSGIVFGISAIGRFDASLDDIEEYLTSEDEGGKE
jgi:hypothetical protein